MSMGPAWGVNGGVNGVPERSWGVMAKPNDLHYTVALIEHEALCMTSRSARTRSRSLHPHLEPKWLQIQREGSHRHLFVSFSFFSVSLLSTARKSTLQTKFAGPSAHSVLDLLLV